MDKQEDQSSNKELLNPLENEENNISVERTQKQNKAQSILLAQMNRTNGRSPNKKYGY